MDKRISVLTECFQTKIKHQFSVKEMARMVNTSSSHLQQLFKIETGISPIQYLRQLRLERSRVQLETTFKQVKEIAVEVGMGDQSHFVRDFKKKYGLTPTGYRKQRWKSHPGDTSAHPANR